jgi:hypothetical protein
MTDNSIQIMYISAPIMHICQCYFSRFNIAVRFGCLMLKIMSRSKQADSIYTINEYGSLPPGDAGSNPATCVLTNVLTMLFLCCCKKY